MSTAARSRSEARAARFLRAALAVAFCVFAPFAALAGWFGALTGDLARIGGWSEHDYGWRAPQPAISVRWNLAARSAPDVLVLGDSFSMGNVWQSVMADRTGLTTLTFGYDGHGCIPEFAALAALPRFASARHVVVETIERHLLDRFERFAPCGPAGPSPFEGPPGTTATARPAGWPTIDWRYLLRTLVDTLRVREAPLSTVRSGDVVNVPLATRELFSNRASARLLYYVVDENKAAWTPTRIEAAARNALAIQRAVQASGRTFTLLVMPDKSSVYRGEVAAGAKVPSGPDFVPAFRAAGVNVVFPLGTLTRAAASTVDLYLPDDTHLSPRGFALVGAEMARDLAEAAPRR